MNLVLEACAHGVTSWAYGRTFEKRAVVGMAVHIADTAEFTLSHTLSVMHDKKGLRQQTETSMRPDSAPSGNGWMSGPIEPSEKPASCADTIQNQQLERPGATVAAAPPHLRQHRDPRRSMRCLSRWDLVACLVQEVAGLGLSLRPKLQRFDLESLAT